MSSSTRDCPACAGTGRFIGSLGTTRHYRCIDCGTPFSFFQRRTAVKESRQVPPTVGQAQEQRRAA